jgi:hypothetical protein
LPKMRSGRSRQRIFVIRIVLQTTTDSISAASASAQRADLEAAE